MKPRIRFNGYWYTCAGGKRVGWGMTMEKAYTDWIRSLMLPIASGFGTE